MARKLGTNLYELVVQYDGTADTATITRNLGVLNRDWTEIVQVSMANQTAGTGAQNYTFVLKVGSTAVTATSGNIANATKDATATVSGLGTGLGVLTEGARLDVTITYAAGVTNGPKAPVTILYRA